MLDLMKQYNDSIEKMIKILSLLVGICFVCMLFIFEISFSDEELKFFLILGCVSLLTGIGFMVSKIKKEVFDCMLFVMTGLFLGIVSGGAYSLIFMMVCLFITIIYGRRAGLLSSFLCSGILLFLETNYFGSISLLMVSYFVGGWRDYFYQSRDFLTGVLSESCFDEVLESFISNNRMFSLIFVRMDDEGYPQVEKKIARILNSQFTFRYGLNGFMVILPDADKGKSVQWLEERIYEIKEVELKSGIVYYPEDGVNLVKKVEDIINSEECLHRYAWMMRHMNGIDSDVVTAIKMLMGFLRVWDSYTYGHVMRVVEYSQCLGRELGISDDEESLLVCGAYLHDIGKLDMDQFILNKRMPLAENEWLRLKSHVEQGVELIQLFEELAPFQMFIRHHHERFDGRGYPSRLEGDEIPFLVRILAVADSFDAMTSKRSYNHPMSYKEGITELRRCSGAQFDPVVVEAFANVIEREYSFGN